MVEAVTRRQGEPQKEPAQPEGPGVGVLARQLQVRTHGRVQAPAHAGFGDPGVDALQGIGIDTEAPGDGRDLQPGQHLRRPQARVRQPEQLGNRAQDRLLRRQTPVGDRPGDALLRRCGTEHRVDVGGIAVDVRSHADDLPGLESRQGRKEPQQPVVQDLDLAVAPVTRLDLDGVVRRVQGGAIRRVGAAPIAQIQDVALDQPKQTGGVRLAKVGQPIAPHVQQLVLKTHAAVTPGGEQRIAQIQQCGTVRGPGQQCAGTPARPPPLVHDVRPILLAGVEDEQMHRDQPGEPGEDPAIDGRQRGGREHQDPLGQGRVGRDTIGECAVEPGEERGTVGGLDLGGELPPQPGLPVVVSGRRALFPLQDHIRTVDQVLVEQVGDATRQLVGLELLRLAHEVARRLRKGRVGDERRQAGEDPPHQPILVPLRLGRQVRKPAAEQVPHQPRRQRKAQIGGDPGLLRQPLGQPAGHPLILGDQKLLAKGVGERLVEHLDQVVEQDLEAVAVMDLEHAQSPFTLFHVYTEVTA